MSNPVWGYVVGQWNVFNFNDTNDPDNNSPNGSPHWVTQWVGLGGNAGYFDACASDAIPQVGVDLYDYCYPNTGCTYINYGAWTEYCPNPLQSVFTPHVNDHITASVLTTDAQGHYMKRGGYAVMAIYDSTRGLANDHTPVPIPPGATFTGNGAEWIIERIASTNGSYTNSCGYHLYNLSNYGSSAMTWAFANADDDRGQCPQELTFGDPNAQTYIYSMSTWTCNGNTLSSVSSGCKEMHGADMNFTWGGWK